MKRKRSLHRRRESRSFAHSAPAMSQPILAQATEEEVYSSLFAPLQGEETQIVIQLRNFDEYLERARNQTYDPHEARRAHDWSLLAHQVVGHESFPHSKPHSKRR